jgi:hypothetical protein
LEGASKNKAGCLFDCQNLKTPTVFDRPCIRLQKQRTAHKVHPEDSLEKA